MFYRDLQAFIWDSPRLEYEAANDCDLTTAGDLFGRSGLGIGLAKGSHWTHPVSLAVLELHESKLLPSVYYCLYCRLCVMSFNLLSALLISFMICMLEYIKQHALSIFEGTVHSTVL